MNSTADPFPASLPGLDSPQIFDSEMADSMQDTDFFFSSALPQDSPGRLFGDDALTTSPYPSPMPMKVRKIEPNSTPADSGHNLSVSPESSLQDSSSDSSGRHKRKSSSRSSRSRLPRTDVTMTESSQPDGRKGHQTTASERQTSFDFAGPSPVNYESFDFSNRAMENDFDFDSAASSPSPLLSSGAAAYSGPRHIAIPYRASPRSAPSLTPHDMYLGATRETSPLSTMIPSDFQPPSLQTSHSSRASSNEEYIDGAMLSGMEQLSTWPYGTDGPHPTTAPVSSIVPVSIPKSAISPIATSKTRHTPPMAPTLLLHPTPNKSRVETQIPIKMTLYPMPEGIAKLHLPPHTISKPKLLAKPPHTKAPDTLELGTMLVCTSAMQDPVKMRRALNRAAQSTGGEKREEGRRSSSGDTSSVVDEENQPLNGGEVNICVGCITRERKRAARKKSKKPEEEEPWQRDEARRIVVFNTTEVKEWQSPSVPNTGDASDEPRQVIPGSTSLPPDNAKQIEVPMRIACYCRHQNEKLGFQVIFTIKDYQDNLIAQAMTSPIVITDDHKTHAPPSVIPPLGPMYADQAQLPGGVFGRESLENYGSALYRNAHSTTDLQGLRNNYNPQFGSQVMNPFASPINSSQNTSTTLTPQNRSRQASPSAQPGPMQKKRKASSSGRLPDGLTMTRIQGASGSHAHNPSWTSATSNPTSPAGTSPFAPTFPSLNGMQERSYGTINNRLPQNFGGPPTPGSMENGGFSAANRSQSLENLSAVQQMFSAPNSAHASRAGSPNSGAQTAINVMPPNHSMQTNSAFSPSSVAPPQRPPTIHKLCPTEGPKAGGIEVTCLGSGFSQGLEVMFGDSLATTTTYWSEASLVCLLPPAIRAGTVAVTFKHQYQQQLQMARYPSPQVPKQQILFKYVDDDESELLKHALLLVHQKMTGTIEDAGDIARRIINAQPNGAGSWNGGTNRGGEHHRQASALQSSLVNAMDVETTVLKCLDLIDLDDSPFQAQFNLRRSNGQSMLHLSASLGFHRLVAGLLARGANPDLRDRNGMSPMHMAALHGHSNIIRRLRLAGGDSTLRSLLGFTPADMASSRGVIDAVQTLSHDSRSRSASNRSRLLYSRGSSATSLRSLWDPPSDFASLSIDDSSADESEDEGSQYSRRSEMRSRALPTPAQALQRSRHNSNALKPPFPVLNQPPQMPESAGMLSPAAAMTAWRDQLAAQIQHFQQSVNWALPNLQIPTLPPMPNLPDYQNHGMIRRFSSLVPQRSPRPSTSGPDSKEGEYRWWELLTGTAASSPPPYEEIYPAKSQEDLDTKTASAARAAADAAEDQKCAVEFDGVRAESSTKGEGGMVTQQEELRSAHARKVKKLRSDRNLFFIWIPLLLFVVMAMLKDRVPQAWHGIQQAVGFVRERYQERVVEVL